MPLPPSVRRRHLLRMLGLLAVSSAACSPVARQPAPTRGDLAPPDAPAWSSTAQAILSDALDALRCFDEFAAFRLGSSTDVAQRTLSDLPWDPPTSSAWDRATTAPRELRTRASTLLRTIASSPAEANTWRRRRAYADNAQALIDLADGLAAYRARVDHLSAGGNGTGALGELQTARRLWDVAAARWGVDRAELIPCA